MSITPRRRPSKVTVRKVGEQTSLLLTPVAELSIGEADPNGHNGIGNESAYPAFQDMLKPALLLALGVYFAVAIVGGSLQNYVSSESIWLVWLGSALFILLGLAGALHLFMTTTNSTEIGADYGVERSLHEQHSDPLDHQEQYEHKSARQEEYHGYHGHHHRIPWFALLVGALPLLLGVLVPSRPLGASALRGRAAPVEFVKGYPTLPDADPSEWNMLQWQRAFNSEAKPQSWFEGQKATVTGFIVGAQDLPSGHYVIARWVMRHCAADAYGLGLLGSGHGGDRLPTDTWVRIRGTMSVISVGNDKALVLNADSMDSSIGQPSPAYISPLWNPPDSN